MAMGSDSLTIPDPYNLRGTTGIASGTVNLPGLPERTGPGPRVIEQPNGGAIVRWGEEQQQAAQSVPDDHDANLVASIDEADLNTWAQELIEGIDADLASRKDWEEDYVKGLKVLALRIDEIRTEPFDGASAARHPLLFEAILRYQATAYPELLPAEGPAKTQLIGPSLPAFEQAADRVREAFNYYLTQTASEYYPDHDRMLFHKAAIGTTFKKVYTCPLLRRPVSAFLLPDDVIVNVNASSIETAQRVTNRIHMRQSDLKRLQLKGFFRTVDLQTPTENQTAIGKATSELEGRTLSIRAGKDDRHTLYETQCERDVPGLEHKDRDGQPTGLPLPWIVTMDRNSRRILRVQRGWE